MPHKILLSGAGILLALVGYFAGRLSGGSGSTEFVSQEITPELGVVTLSKITGDSLEIEIKGPTRVLWSEAHVAEGEGLHQIPLGQIPDENDLALEQFPYLGNAKTGNFYPSDSYPARGTQVRYRRFFETKAAAIAAGFKASKLVQ